MHTDKAFACARLQLLILLVLAVQPDAIAQEDSMRMQYGVYAHGGLAQHQAHFRAFEGVAFCCPREFDDVVTGATSFGVLTSWPLASWIQLQTRLGLQFQSPRFSVVETTTFNEPTTNEAITSGKIEYAVEASTRALDLWMLGTLQLLPRLSLSVGSRLQYIVHSSFAQYEKILSPDSLVFVETQSNIWNDVRGEIPGLNRIQFGPAVGFSYEIPISANGGYLLVPEIMGVINLTNYSSSMRDGGSWSSAGLSFGITFVSVR